jgi:NADH:ubiquinone oxidoreductase subunit H
MATNKQTYRVIAYILHPVLFPMVPFYIASKNKLALPPLQQETELVHHKNVEFSLFFFFFAILVLELRAFALNYSTSPIFVKGFSR